MKRSVRPIRNRITALRIEHGWTQDQLAHESRVSKRTIERVEKGKPAFPDTYSRIAQALGTTIPEIAETNGSPLDLPAHNNGEESLGDSVHVYVRIDTDFDSFSEQTQLEWLKQLRDALKLTGQVTVTAKQPGCVELALVLTRSDAKLLIEGFQAGILDRLDVVEAVTDTVSTGRLSRARPPKQNPDRWRGLSAVELVELEQHFCRVESRQVLRELAPDSANYVSLIGTLLGEIHAYLKEVVVVKGLPGYQQFAKVINPDHKQISTCMRGEQTQHGWADHVKDMLHYLMHGDPVSDDSDDRTAEENEKAKQIAERITHYFFRDMQTGKPPAFFEPVRVGLGDTLCSFTEFAQEVAWVSRQHDMNRARHTRKGWDEPAPPSITFLAGDLPFVLHRSLKPALHEAVANGVKLRFVYLKGSACGRVVDDFCEGNGTVPENIEKLEVTEEVGGCCSFFHPVQQYVQIKFTLRDSSIERLYLLRPYDRDDHGGDRPLATTCYPSELRAFNEWMIRIEEGADKGGFPASSKRLAKSKRISRNTG